LRIVGDHQQTPIPSCPPYTTIDHNSVAYPLGYIEGLNDARTLLADFFSIPLVAVEEGEGL
jgi:hypothetical protein